MKPLRLEGWASPIHGTRWLPVLLLIFALIGLAGGVTGCAHRGVNFAPLVDMQGKAVEQFNADLADCQSYARQSYNAAQAAVAGAITTGLIAALLTPRGYRNDAAMRAGLLGAAGGAGVATETQEQITRRCLGGRGYNVLN